MQPRIKNNLSAYQRDTYTDKSSLQLDMAQPYLDCSLGVNPYGCPPGVLGNAVPVPELITSYPASDPDFIRQIRNYWQSVAPLQEDNIQLEAGTFGVIERLNKLFIDTDSIVLGYCPQFSDYMQDVTACGGRYEYVSLKPENNYRFIAGDLLAALHPRYKLVYLDNPNNPTGQVIPLDEIESIVQEAETMGIAVLVDEAYGDYMPRENSAIALVPEYNNLFVARSFTKGFGLAGLRAGYVVMSLNLLKYYSLVAHPFPVNALGQYYAKIALQDENFLAECRARIRNNKEQIRKACSKFRILATDPATPICTLVHPRAEVDLQALFLNNHILTTSGRHFVGLGQSAVRIRIPGDGIDHLITTIKTIEEQTT